PMREDKGPSEPDPRCGAGRTARKDPAELWDRAGGEGLDLRLGCQRWTWSSRSYRFSRVRLLRIEPAHAMRRAALRYAHHSAKEWSSNVRFPLKERPAWARRRDFEVRSPHGIHLEFLR